MQRGTVMLSLVKIILCIQRVITDDAALASGRLMVSRSKAVRLGIVSVCSVLEVKWERIKIVSLIHVGGCRRAVGRDEVVVVEFDE